MPRKSPRPPSYPRKAHSSGQARIKVRGEVIYLGKFSSPESYEEYKRIVAKWEASGGLLPIDDHDNAAVAEVVAVFLRHAKEQYAGKRELENIKSALTVLHRVHGRTRAKDFDCKKLREVQAAMACGSWMAEEERKKYQRMKWTMDWSHGYICRQTTRIRTAWAWLEENGYVPKGSTGILGLVRGSKLKARHSGEPYKAKPEEIAALVKVLSRTPAVMLQLQWHAAVRTDEVIAMRTMDIDQASIPDVWLYTPGSELPFGRHKNAWRQQRRIIPLNKACQELLKPFLQPDEPAAYIFVPRRTVQEINLLRAMKRKTKVQPSQANGIRKKKNPKRAPNEVCYSRSAYARAIRRAAEKAGLPNRFRPYSCRHGQLRQLARQFGAEAARAQAGHKTIETTELYLGMDLEHAIEIARKIGNSDEGKNSKG